MMNIKETPVLYARYVKDPIARATEERKGHERYQRELTKWLHDTTQKVQIQFDKSQREIDKLLLKELGL